MADCTADHDRCVWKSCVGSLGLDLVWQEVKEVKIGGHQQIFMEKAGTRITRCAVVKDK